MRISCPKSPVPTLTQNNASFFPRCTDFFGLDLTSPHDVLIVQFVVLFEGNRNPFFVIPAQAGIQRKRKPDAAKSFMAHGNRNGAFRIQVPAFAKMTDGKKTLKNPIKPEGLPLDWTTRSS
jgi:hypothetical protein